jgi:cytochrome bd-type quinol oxidase subunit 1
MSDLLAARSLMAVSLNLHSVYAVIGIGVRVLMVLAQGRWIRRPIELRRKPELMIVDPQTSG